MKNAIRDHFDRIAYRYSDFKNKNRYYYQALKKLLGLLIPPSKKVLEIGCGTGDLLYHLHPQKGIGIDISRQMIRIARRKYPGSNLRFIASPLNSFLPEEKFDYIFMSDVIEHLDDIETSFRRISKIMSENSIFICTMANPIWEPILHIAEKLNLKMPEGPHNRIGFQEIDMHCKRNNLRIFKHSFTLLCPVYIPFLSEVINSHLEDRFRKLSFIEYFEAKKL